MKRILALLVALTLVAGVVFAQEEGQTRREREIELFNLEFSLGFPVHFSSSIDDDTVALLSKTMTANTAFGLATTFNFTRKIGLTLDMDIFYGGRLNGISSDNSDYVSLFGANVILGPVFYVYNTNPLRIQFGTGVHLYYYSDQLWVPDLGGAGTNSGYWIGRKDLQLGLALSLAVQFHFDNNLYIFSKTNIVIDGFRMLSIDTDDPNASVSNTYILDFSWGIKPSIGLGIKY